MRRSWSTAWNHERTKSSCARAGGPFSMYSRCIRLSYVRARFCWRPGGASKVILSDCWSRMLGKVGWGSVVSHSRNSGCGVIDESSFSSVGTQWTTRWRFLRQSHAPLLAASWSIVTAAWVVCPPIASCLNFPAITRFA